MGKFTFLSDSLRRDFNEKAIVLQGNLQAAGLRDRHSLARRTDRGQEICRIREGHTEESRLHNPREGGLAMRHEKTGMEWVEAHDHFIKTLIEDNAMPMNEYEVVITGTFRKTITVSAINEDEAAMAVEDHPWTITDDDVIDYEIEDVFME